MIIKSGIIQVNRSKELYEWNTVEDTQYFPGLSLFRKGS